VTAPLVTAMVSTYASERYLRGCLDDLLAQTRRAELEIVVIDAASPEREGEIVRAYQQQHANIRYVRTEDRESTSDAFRRATALARGRYLTTANTDDRHHPEFCARLLAVLERCPQFGLAYADAAIGTVDNEGWAGTTATRRFRWPDYTPAAALSCCLFGAQPMWRKDAHALAGDWSNEFPIANDHDMFLRLARGSGAVHVDEVLGLFLQRPDSNAGRDRGAAVLADACAVMKKHRRSWALDEIVPGATAAGPLATAAAWFELGNLCALGPYTDGDTALDAYRAALDLPLAREDRLCVQAAFANNAGCILLAGALLEPAARAFAACPPSPARDHNVSRLHAAAQRAPALRELRFVELEHPVVQASRTTGSVTVDATGGVHFAPAHEQRPWHVFDGPNGVPWQRTAVEPALAPA
jgi:hypothetical protein